MQTCFWVGLPPWEQDDIWLVALLSHTAVLSGLLPQPACCHVHARTCRAAICCDNSLSSPGLLRWVQAVSACCLGAWCCRDWVFLKCCVTFDRYWIAFWVAGLLKLQTLREVRDHVWGVTSHSSGKEGKRACCLTFPAGFLAGSEPGNLN